MIKTRTVHDDGSISIAVNKLEKTIRASDGTLQKMVSFDGEVWRLEAHENKEALRLSRAANLRGRKWLKAKTQHFNARHVNQGTGYQPPVILPVEHHGNPFLGKEKGKNQKYRRNLRRRKADKEVKLKRENIDIDKLPVIHRHRCHDKFFICSCEFPYLKRKCGGSAGCLREMKGGLK
jgi:hypothetical protein